MAGLRSGVVQITKAIKKRTPTSGSIIRKLTKSQKGDFWWRVPGIIVDAFDKDDPFDNEQLVEELTKALEDACPYDNVDTFIPLVVRAGIATLQDVNARTEYKHEMKLGFFLLCVCVIIVAFFTQQISLLTSIK